MTVPSESAETGSRWTCPACLVLCDSLRVCVHPTANDRPDDSNDAQPNNPPRYELHGHCTPAAAWLERVWPDRALPNTPLIDGQPCSFPDAVQQAATLLATSRQPLFGGLGTDVAGARALYRLACATGAICDPTNGAAWIEGVRATQDHGLFTTTLAEVRAHADLIVCVGGLPSHGAEDLMRRCGIGQAGLARRLVLVGGSAQEHAGLWAWPLHDLQVMQLSLEGDLFDTVQGLAGQVLANAPPACAVSLRELADALRAARYAVFIGSTACVPAHGGLLVEAIDRIVARLNEHTRAAALWLGGGDGVRTVNEVFTWLSGLPLRSRAGPLGLEHEPVCFDARRLLDDAAVDLLLWVSSFEPDRLPPVNADGLPTLLLGHPRLARAMAQAGRSARVFIPVSTPGLGSPGHLFRVDGRALMPLAALFDDELPRLGPVLDAIGLARMAWMA